MGHIFEKKIEFVPMRYFYPKMLTKPNIDNFKLVGVCVDISYLNVFGGRGDDGGIFSLLLSFSSGSCFTRWVAVVYTKNVLWGRKRCKYCKQF